MKESILERFCEFSEKYDKLIESHNVLLIGFYKLLKIQTGVSEKSFPKIIKSISCNDLNKAISDLESIRESKKIRPNSMYKQYLSAKHRMLVEEYQLQDQYQDLADIMPVRESLNDLYKRGMLNEEILTSIINMAQKSRQS